MTDTGAGVLLVTNVLTHYRRPLFRRLAATMPVRFVFFSDGGEPYCGTAPLDLDGLPGRNLPGAWVGGTRIPCGLVREVVTGPHDVVVKCINGKVALPAVYLAARLRGRRFVLWTGIWQHPAGLVHRLSRPLTRHLYRHADAVVTYGRHVSRYVIGEGADPQRVVVACQSVDLDVFRPAVTATADGSAAPLVLYVGRLEQEKGPQLLLEALAGLRAAGVRFQARFVGAGALRERLTARAGQLGLAGQVVFVGPRQNAELPEEYRRAAVTVVPSLRTPAFSEPWSLAVNEAMGCGSAVLASTAVGAVQDGLVTDGVTGAVFPWGDVAALERRLAALLSDPAGRRGLADAGLRAVQDYSHATAAEAFGRAVAIARRGVR